MNDNIKEISQCIADYNTGKSSDHAFSHHCQKEYFTIKEIILGIAFKKDKGTVSIIEIAQIKSFMEFFQDRWSEKQNQNLEQTFHEFLVVGAEKKVRYGPPSSEGSKNKKGDVASSSSRAESSDG